MSLEIAHKKDLEVWLKPEELALLENLRWLAWKAPNFLSLFVGSQDFKSWESHWFGTGSAFRALTDCRESIKMFFKSTGQEKVIGLTPCLDKKALKMAKLLGYKPLGFLPNRLNEVCLLSVKEKE